MAVTLDRFPFGVTGSGQAIERYRFENDSSTSVDIITYGGVITSWRHADRNGVIDDIVLGYDTLADYEACQIYMGCIAGRYANRIAHGRFTLDGKHFQLECNNGSHHLHGGSQGLHRMVWQAEIETGPVLVLRHRSEHGAGGYPGTVDFEVRYALDNHNALSIEYRASTDRPTVVNLTSHSYFNLRGDRHAGPGGIMGHRLQVSGSEVLLTDDEGIPIGPPFDVRGSGFDFTEEQPFAMQAAALQSPGLDGYDHCYVLNAGDCCARLYSPESGRRMTVSSSLPGLQVYSAGYVNDCAGRNGAVYGRGGSICLEAQFLPDSPNRPEFPSVELRPGEPWRQHVSYQLKNDL
jgi:aldose 1-epimerase